MAVQVGALSVDLAASTADFSRDLRRAGQQVRAFQTRIGRNMQRVESRFKRAGVAALGFGRSLARINPAVAALSGAAGIGGLVLLVRRSLDFADAIGKTADKVGVTTDELQKLRFAAEQAGVTQQTLDMGLQRFSRRVGEAAVGTGELRTVLDRYGISVRDASGQTRSVTDVLADLADAVANADSHSEQLAITFKAVDSEAAALVNLFRQGGQAIRDAGNQLEGLGGVLDEEVIRNAEAANNALDLLTTVIRVNFVNAIASAAPQIKGLADEFIDLVPSILNAVEAFAKWIGIIETTELDRINKQIESLERLIARIETPVTLGGVEFRGFNAPQNLRTRLDELERARDAITRSRVSPGTFPIQAGGLRIEAARVEDAVSKGTEQGVSAALDKARPIERPIPPGTRIPSPIQKPLIPAQLQPPGMFGDLTKVQEQYVSNQRRINDATEEWGRSGERAGFVIGSHFSNLIFQGEELRFTIANILKDLGRLVFFESATKPLAGLIGKGISAVAGSLFGFQHGGSFTVGGPGGTDNSLVAFRATRGEEVSVTPAGRSGIPRSGMTVFIDNRGADRVAVQRLERLFVELNANFEERAVGSVVDARNRDPHLFS